jgi:ABC-type oligopeptide transport system substrate-binding subunit
MASLCTVNPSTGWISNISSYVNPDAPKGGEARFAAIGSFDTFNPFNIKGQAAAGIGQLFETLMTSSADEPFSEYGLIAESVDVADDRSSVMFKSATAGEVSRWFGHHGR